MIRRIDLLTLAIVLSLASLAEAQQRLRGHVLLPPTSGATVLSTHLHAQAARAVAMGDFLESAAVARRINLESDRIAMENSVRWVETYFERRRLNREYRDEERMDYHERKLVVGRQLHQDIENSYARGNPAEAINFMMRRLIADSSANQVIFLSQVPDIEGADFFLSPNQLSHILLRQVGGSEGARTLRPTDPELVSEHWPNIFLRSEFDLERIAYDQVRQQALDEIRKNNQLSVVTLEAVQRSLHQLQAKFEEVYQWPKLKGTLDIATFTHCRDTGENFFRSQAAGTLRAFAMNQPDSYADELRFNGDNIVDLLRHCSQRNLEFARPESGDESTYAHLFQQVRLLYLDFIPNEPDF